MFVSDNTHNMHIAYMSMRDNETDQGLTLPAILSLASLQPGDDCLS